MASLTKRENGSRFISFTGSDGARQTITLGKVARRYAESVKVKVEDLLSARLNGHVPRDETSRWLARLDDRLYDKLARVDLVPARVRTSLKAWLTQYLRDRSGELKPESLRKMKQTTEKLLTFFGPDVELRKITEQNAVAWRAFLKESNLSEAAIKTHSGNAKTIFANAVRRKLIIDNPFALLKSGPTASRYSRFVTVGEIEKVIEACPNAEWRLLFGLARYAGLRVPSESHRLTLEDVDLARCRLTVHSPKTEHHPGHEQRTVPITRRLMQLIQNRLEELEPGQDRLITIGGKGTAMIRRVRRIWTQAGIEPWDRCWQTLRQSCEKQWAMSFPQYAVSKWIGHSITISGRHYANAVPDELFDKAAEISGDTQWADRGADIVRGGAQRHAQRKTSENGGNARRRNKAAEHVGDRISADCRELPRISVNSCITRKWSRGESNPRAVTVELLPLHA